MCKLEREDAPRDIRCNKVQSAHHVNQLSSITCRLRSQDLASAKGGHAFWGNATPLGHSYSEIDNEIKLYKWPGSQGSVSWALTHMDFIVFLQQMLLELALPILTIKALPFTLQNIWQDFMSCTRFNVDCVMSNFDAYKHGPIRLVQSPLMSIQRKEKKYLILCGASMHVQGSAFSCWGAQ